MVFEEKTISSEMIYEGSILNLRKDKVHVRDEKVSFREIVEHRGGVAIAAITDDWQMVMVKQFRKAAEAMVLEVPAGKFEADEKDPLEVAKRELKEETGYDAENMEFITSFYSSIGYSSEVLHLYIASGLTSGETKFDDAEAIEIYEYDIDELKDMILSGKIIDAKTIIAILLVESKLEQDRLLAKNLQVMV